MVSPSTRQPAIICPYCRDRLMVRSSEQLTMVCREVRLGCNNIECEASFVGQIVITGVVIPGHAPIAALNLPVSNPRLTKARRAANDDMPFAANEEPPAAPIAGNDMQSG